MVKRQSMPDSTCSVCINVYVFFAIVLLLLLEVGKLHTMPCAMMCERTLASLRSAEVAFHYKIPCAMMALATFMKPAMLAPFT